MSMGPGVESGNLQEDAEGSSSGISVGLQPGPRKSLINLTGICPGLGTFKIFVHK